MNLFTPGPVNISVAAQQAIGRPRMFHHRSDQFQAMMTRLNARLKDAFLTGGEVLTLTSSGTGAMDAAVSNLLSPGERVLVPVSGKFSRRWAEISEAYGVEVRRIELEPGEAPQPEAIVSELKADPGISAALLTHCETSTGSLTDLESICAAIHGLEQTSGRKILIIADCITSLYLDELRVDDWGIDCAVAASQKGLLAPPGLAFVALGERALARLEPAPAAGAPPGAAGHEAACPESTHLEPGVSPSYYFDLRKYLGGEMPFTPAIPLVDATLASLEYLAGLGLEPVWRASRSGAAALRLLSEAAGMKPVARRQASGVVALWTEGLDTEKIARAFEREHYIIVAQGQADLRGRILRASPIGKSPAMLRGFATALTAVLARLGRTLDVDSIEADFDRLLEDCAIWE
jgi:aspartate aminotransferase-like enzyme